MRWYRAVGALGALATTATAGDDRPNILFILTDDQDSLMDSLDFMPSVQKHIAAKGVSFERHYCTGSFLWRNVLSFYLFIPFIEPPPPFSRLCISDLTSGYSFTLLPKSCKSLDWTTGA